MGFIFAALFARMAEDHADGKAEDRRERNNAAAERKLHAGVTRDGQEQAAGFSTKERFR